MGEPVQPPPQPQPYGPPQPPAGPQSPPKGMATTALVLGIVGLVLSVLGCTWFLGLPCDILAVIFGAVGMSKAKTGEQGGEGMAKAGLVCGIIGFFVVIAWIVFALMFGAWVSSQYQYYRFY